MLITEIIRSSASQAVRFFAKAVRECNSNHPYVLIFTGHQLSATGTDAFYWSQSSPFNYLTKSFLT
ncbi:hypothetical protein CHCC20335_0462 [Bacillus paralicheniformis]|nr:hypothetical protein CHCC20335_0462 [Bacillus paralicheniformis]